MLCRRFDLAPTRSPAQHETALALGYVLTDALLEGRVRYRRAIQ